MSIARLQPSDLVLVQGNAYIDNSFRDHPLPHKNKKHPKSHFLYMNFYQVSHILLANTLQLSI